MMTPVTLMSLAGATAAAGIVLVGLSTTPAAVPDADITQTSARAESPSFDELMEEIEPAEVTEQTTIDLSDANHRWHNLEIQVADAPIVPQSNEVYQVMAEQRRELKPLAGPPHLQGYSRPRSMVERTRRFYELREVARQRERDDRTRISRSRIQPRKVADRFSAAVRDNVYKRSRDYGMGGSSSLTLKRKLDRHLRGNRSRGPAPGIRSHPTGRRRFI